MKFFEDVSPNGHLEVWKYFSDGSKELHWEDKNVICSGMGATLAEMFDAPFTANVNDYQIIYFKVGSSGNDSLQVSSTGDLSGALTRAQYGTGNLDISTHNLIKNGGKITTAGAATSFGVIPYGYIKRVTPTKCMWQIVLDEQTANVGDATHARYLNEIGLFSKNPYREATDASLLCAYRFFKPIYKSDAFILVFRWTIEF